MIFALVSHVVLCVNAEQADSGIKRLNCAIDVKIIRSRSLTLKCDDNVDHRLKINTLLVTIHFIIYVISQANNSR